VIAPSDDTLKAFANRLAEAARSPVGGDVVRLLQATGLLASHRTGTDTNARAGETSAAREIVGVWQRAPGARHFVRRRAAAAEWPFWANAGRIEPKQCRRRVVLIGESVARGFLYDPEFTPAMVLQTMLRGTLGDDGCDVVDLARVNLSLAHVRDLAHSVHHLEPDVVVLFAGNNWSRVGFNRLHCATALRRGGLPAMKAAIEDDHRRAVGAVVADAIRTLQARGIGVVWVIPEFNLGDWRDPATNAPWLWRGSHATWLAHYRAARAALADGDHGEAARHAELMVATDGGTCVTGPYLLADCATRRGDQLSARRHLETARDATIWSPFVLVPRPHAVSQNVLRETAAATGAALVDLPALFQEVLDGGVPDRRLFLDYCHLNAAAIETAMAATAAAVHSILPNGTRVPWQSFLGRGIKPSRRVEAEALFMAALHNAHYGQGPPLLEYYCTEALRQSPHVAEPMEAYLEVQTRRAPTLMCAAMERIEHLACPLIQHYLLRWNARQQLDRGLLNAVTAALQLAGVDAGGRIERMRIDERSVLRREEDLLDAYYESSGFETFARHRIDEERTVGTTSRAHFFQAHSPDSRFVFVAETGHDVRLSLTCRVPDLAAPGAIALEVNGRPHGSLAIGNAWRDHTVSVHGSFIRDGLNDLTIRWPVREFDGDAATVVAADDLTAGLFPGLYPVFGELHRLTASAPPPCGPTSVSAIDHGETDARVPVQ
jgi:hypothetical protein